MTRLLLVELRRLFSRSLVILTMVCAVAFSVLSLVGVWQTTRPVTDEELAQAQKYYEDELVYWEDHGEEDIAACYEAEAEESEELGRQVDWECDTYGPPELEWFIHTAPPLNESLAYQIAGFGVLPMLIGLIIGTTFTAAEMSTGSISTWLSFEPRRLRVFASKVLAAAAGTLPLALIMLAVLVLGTWAIHAQVGLAGGMTAAVWTDVIETALRILAAAGVAALVGAALGTVLRHTAAVLGGAIVYVVVEQLITQSFPRIQPWVLTMNISSWIEGGRSYYIETCTVDAAGMMCDYTEHTLTLGHSAVYLAVLTVVVVGVSALIFRRRNLG